MWQGSDIVRRNFTRKKCKKYNQKSLFAFTSNELIQYFGQNGPVKKCIKKKSQRTSIFGELKLLPFSRNEELDGDTLS